MVLFGDIKLDPSVKSQNNDLVQFVSYDLGLHLIQAAFRHSLLEELTYSSEQQFYVRRKIDI